MTRTHRSQRITEGRRRPGGTACRPVALCPCRALRALLRPRRRRAVRDTGAHPRPRRAAAAVDAGSSAGRASPTSARRAARDVPDRLRSVVYLETAPRGAFEAAEPGHAVMDQRNETFVPHVLAITTGTTVDFPNSDSSTTTCSRSRRRGRSISAATPPAARKSVRFDRPGIVRVFCDIHSHMNAFILVFSHPFFAMTDAEGRYRIDNVPPGTYSVVAWNEGDSVRAAGRSPCPTAASPNWTSRCDDAAVVAAQPDLPRQRAARGALDRRRDLRSSTSRVTREAERTLQREIVATGALVDQLRADAHADVHADGAAHRRPAEAEGRGRHQRSADGRRTSPSDYQEQLKSQPAARHERDRAACSRPSGDSPRRGRDRRRPAGGPRRARRPRKPQPAAAAGRHPAGGDRADRRSASRSRRSSARSASASCSTTRWRRS